MVLSLMLQGSWVVTIGALAASVRQGLWVDFFFAFVWLLLFPIGFIAFVLNLIFVALPSINGARYDEATRTWSNANTSPSSKFKQQYGLIFEDYKGTRAARL